MHRRGELKLHGLSSRPPAVPCFTHFSNSVDDPNSKASKARSAEGVGSCDLQGESDMMTRIASVLCVLSLTACAPISSRYSEPSGPNNQPVPERNVEPVAEFDEAAMRAAFTQGHAIIRGQAFAKTRGGDVKYGAGNNILVVPFTGYVDECQRLLQSGFHSECANKISPFARTISADGEGRFEISSLKPGKYQLATDISWEVPTGYGLERTGGSFVKVVEVVSDADIVTVNLTP